MLEVLLIRPGSTLFDEEGRIKGALDMPLTTEGTRQVKETAEKLASMHLERLYLAPDESAQQTGKILAKRCGWKVRTVACFRNLDHGLWQGKLVDDVRRFQPKVYKQFQDELGDLCPPGGETIRTARQRVAIRVQKLTRRHRTGLVGLVVPDPMATLVRCELVGCNVGDLWKAELDSCTWELLNVERRLKAASFN